MGKKRFTVTSALLYANGPIHLGHLAGAYLPADIYVRYQKLKGHDVAFICGSDEHGAAITLQAKKEGVSPQEIVDKYHELNKNSFKDFGINFDIYDRTSSQDHHETAQEVFASSGPAMQKIIGELIAAKQIKVLMAKNETLLFSDPALDLTDDVTSMLDVAAAEANSTSEELTAPLPLSVLPLNILVPAQTSL